jgi:uncharacterized membrane protein
MRDKGMRIPRLRPISRPLDAILLIVLMVGIVAGGYALGLGWAGLAGPIVIIGAAIIQLVRRRSGQRRRRI